MKEALKRKINFVLTIFGGMLPMMLFLDYGLDIRLAEHGFIKTMGFICCVVFYSKVTN